MRDLETWTEITIDKFKSNLKQAGNKYNILVYGKSGYGKSQAVYEYAEENNLKVIEVNLALEMPENIGGIPYVALHTDSEKLYDKDAVKKAKAEVKEYFVRLLDSKLKPVFESEGKNYILFFDEINQGVAEVLNALYGICYTDPAKRNWAGHNIGKAQVVACGNLSNGEDKNVYLTELPDPLLNRFFCFKLKPDKKGATKYLSTKFKNIPQVKRYITLLLDNDVAPRDVEAVLDILNFECDSSFMESKIDSALTAKVYDIQKQVKDTDPSKLIKNAHKLRKQLKEDGEIEFGVKTITNEEELKEALSEYLSDEEIAGVMKGDVE